MGGRMNPSDDRVALRCLWMNEEKTMKPQRKWKFTTPMISNLRNRSQTWYSTFLSLNFKVVLHFCSVRVHTHTHTHLQPVSLPPQEGKYYSEEAEVDLRDPGRDYELYKYTCQELQRLMAEIQDLKSRGGKEAVSSETGQPWGWRFCKGAAPPKALADLVLLSWIQCDSGALGC